MSERPAPPKPRPVPDERSAGYWAAAARHELALPQCARCGKVFMPSGPVCPYCHSSDPGLGYVRVEGRGTVRSWTLVHDAFLPAFRDDLPFVLVDVELSDHPHVRLIARLVDGPDAPLHLGDPVSVAFDDLGDGVVIPVFALDGDRT